MKFKLDENFGTRTQQLFRVAGHDVQTTRDQELQGCSDQHLYEVCCAEQRCLVTLDLDFSDVTRFSPAQANGIVVIRVPRNPSLALLEKLVRQFLQMLTQMPVEKKLWIVEIARIRVHESGEDTEPGFKEKEDNSG
jgi:predicted nuclease of predicted toxin-antitoxin system